MDRKTYWTLGLWLALAVMVIGGLSACTASLKLDSIGITATAEVDEWAQANVLKAIDDLIAKVPDPNKKDGDDEETAETVEDVPDDAGGVDGADDR